LLLTLLIKSHTTSLLAACQQLFFLYACGLRAHPPTIPACELALTNQGFKDNDQSLCYEGGIDASHCYTYRYPSV